MYHLKVGNANIHSACFHVGLHKKIQKYEYWENIVKLSFKTGHICRTDMAPVSAPFESNWKFKPCFYFLD